MFRLLPLLLIAGLVGVSVTAGASATTFYVDCSAGSNANSGSSDTFAWRTLAYASTQSLAPNTTLLLKRGCTWEGTWTVPWSGVSVGAYGPSSDPLPRIQNSQSNLAANVVHVTGNGNTLDSLYVRSDPRYVVANPDPNAGNAALNGSVRATGCPGTGHGGPGTPYRYGVVIDGNGNTLSNSLATELVDAVNVVGSGNHVLYNEFHDINQDGTLTVGGSDDYGAQAIEIQGPDNEVAFNWLHDNIVCSYDFGVDGSEVTIWGSNHADRNHIHHNRGDNSVNFAEMATGGGSANDNVFDHNVSTRESFLVGVNAGLRTHILNNSVYAAERGHGGIVGGNSTSVAEMRFNIFNTVGAQVWMGSPATEERNLLWHGSDSGVCYVVNNSSCSKPPSTDIVADPLFVSGTDLHLRAGSPAIGAGNPDIGALPFGATPPTSTATATPTTPPTGTPAPSATPTAAPLATDTPTPTSTTIPTSTPTSCQVQVRNGPAGMPYWIDKPGFC